MMPTKSCKTLVRECIPDNSGITIHVGLFHCLAGPLDANIFVGLDVADVMVWELPPCGVITGDPDLIETVGP